MGREEVALLPYTIFKDALERQRLAKEFELDRAKFEARSEAEYGIPEPVPTRPAWTLGLTDRPRQYVTETDGGQLVTRGRGGLADYGAGAKHRRTARLMRDGEPVMQRKPGTGSINRELIQKNRALDIKANTIASQRAARLASLSNPVVPENMQRTWENIDNSWVRENTRGVFDQMATMQNRDQALMLGVKMAPHIALAAKQELEEDPENEVLKKAVKFFGKNPARWVKDHFGLFEGDLKHRKAMQEKEVADVAGRRGLTGLQTEETKRIAADIKAGGPAARAGASRRSGLGITKPTRLGILAKEDRARAKDVKDAEEKIWNVEQMKTLGEDYPARIQPEINFRNKYSNDPTVITLVDGRPKEWKLPRDKAGKQITAADVYEATIEYGMTIEQVLELVGAK